MLRLALQSLTHYWRTNLGVLCGIALASAVLTGALLVGDSVDYSLKTFARLRLGSIEQALDARNQFVQQSLAQRLADASNTPVAPMLRLRGMAIFQGDTPEDRAQVNKVDVHGVDELFWAFGNGEPFALASNETALSTRLAEALAVGVGDEVSLRVLKPSLMARDSPLSWRSDDRSRRGRYLVAHVVSDEEMGRFGLSPSQAAPFNAYLDLAHLQEQVELEGKVNVVLSGGGANEVENALQQAWQTEDIGLGFRKHESGMVQLESDRIFLDDETVRAGLSLPGAQGALTYMANSLSVGDRLTPYFFAVAGPVPETMRDDEIVINRWVADEIAVDVGDKVTLAYSVVLPNNEFEERSRDFTVHGIREMESLKTERELMPVYPGLSDVENCADWDVGMPMDEELLNDEANEEYWDAYRETPKAFVTLAAGQDMWANRFGTLTAVRFEGGNSEALHASLRAAMDPAKAGVFFMSVREQADAAVAQAMDFGGLFLGMSFFLIVSALLLTGLLFVFGAQQRASQIGTLLAVGFRTRTVRRLLLSEAAVIAAVGSVLGAGLGVLYTRALIFGLSNYWQGATADTRILYHATAGTLIVGVIATLVCALLSMFIAVRRLSRQRARDLLHMDFAQPLATSTAGPGMTAWVVPSILLALALGIVGASRVTDVGSVSGAFFGAGALLLLSGMGFFRWFLLACAGGNTAAFGLRQLALLNLTRRPGRSVAVAGLLACGCFLVFAVSGMQEDLAAHADRRSAGTGGFALVADATFALPEDPVAGLDEPDVTASLIKVRDGDDASCLNLTQAQTPRLLGVDVDDLVARGAFASEGEAEALWNLLREPLPGGEIPALVGDSNTAMWTLRKKTGANGDVLLYQDENGDEAPIKLVGQLPQRLSLFQGSVLIAQEDFARLFPAEDGHRKFLIDAPAGELGDVVSALARRYDRYGLDAAPAVQRLQEFYTVEATYLAIFLLLGGLGVVVGGLGMGVVVLRNLFERRAELAMLWALGFRRETTRRVLLVEYGLLLLAGLGVGGVAAVVAMLPAVTAAESRADIVTQSYIAVGIVLSYAACMGAAVWAGSGLPRIDDLRSE